MRPINSPIHWFWTIWSLRNLKISISIQMYRSTLWFHELVSSAAANRWEQQINYCLNVFLFTTVEPLLFLKTEQNSWFIKSYQPINSLNGTCSCFTRSLQVHVLNKQTTFIYKLLFQLDAHWQQLYNKAERLSFPKLRYFFYPFRTAWLVAAHKTSYLTSTSTRILFLFLFQAALWYTSTCRFGMGFCISI